MPAYRDKRNGSWRWRTRFKLPNGEMRKLSGTAPEGCNTKHAAEAEERAAVAAVLRMHPSTNKEVPTFREWFEGRFWQEWVIGRENKPSEVEAKKSVFKNHLGPAFGQVRIDKIGVGEVARFRAALLQRQPKLSRKSINNILAILSKPLRYAVDVELIMRAPKVGLLKVERPEIQWWDFDEYQRILEAAKVEGSQWYAAVCLAGEAGLRIGEVRALRWREDVDLIAGTITVNQQTRKGITGTPKGGTRRKVPMNPTLLAAKRQEVVRTGFVVRNADGTQLNDGQTNHTLRRIFRRAGLPERGWHSMRHSFGTHAAMLGVNPWRLQAWMGHKRIDETHLYVHMAGEHMRPMPPEFLQAAAGEVDPDRRIVLMLASRANKMPTTQPLPGESAGLLGT